MAAKPETVFKNKIRPLIESLPRSWWAKIQQVVIRGTPDFIGCIGGHFVAIELKSSRTAPLSKLQAWVREKILDAGGTYLIAYPENWEETYNTLQRISRDQAKVQTP